MLDRRHRLRQRLRRLRSRHLLRVLLRVPHPKLSPPRLNLRGQPVPTRTTATLTLQVEQSITTAIQFNTISTGAMAQAPAGCLSERLVQPKRGRPRPAARLRLKHDPPFIPRSFRHILRSLRLPLRRRASRHRRNRAVLPVVRQTPPTPIAPVVPSPTRAIDRKSTRLNSSHVSESRMPSY